MGSWKQQIPRGVQDYLPEECYNKRKVEKIIRGVCFARGYDEMESSIFEYYDVFTGDKSYIEQEKMFKIVEAGGRIQVLRPDMTMPIARIGATKLRESQIPIRLSYLGNVYRYEELQTGRQREIAQAGVELLGIKGPEADAEVIATAIQCLLELGLKDFQVDIGQVEFFKGLAQEAQLNPKEFEELRLLVEQKNILALESFLENTPISNHLRQAFLELPQMYGDINILSKGLKYGRNPHCQRAIDNIREVYDILKDYGLEQFITFDLGMVHSLNYYTGIIFRVFTRDLGFSICGGGRYDNLFKEFGRDLPATGFALGLKRILTVLDRQGGLKPMPSTDILVVLEKNGGQKGYALAQTLRSEGNRVEIYLKPHENYDPIDYAKSKDIRKIIYVTENGKREELL